MLQPARLRIGWGKQTTTITCDIAEEGGRVLRSMSKPNRPQTLMTLQAKIFKAKNIVSIPYEHYVA
jgi:hypothetical protein